MKHVLFLIPQDKNNHSLWDGDAIRNGGVGASGTHQSFVIVAEQMMKNKTIEQAYIHNFCKESCVNGVRYIRDTSSISSLIDTVIVLPWYAKSMHAFADLCNTYPKLKTIVVWFQCQLLEQGTALSIINSPPSLEIVFVHLSYWSKNNVIKMSPPNVLARINKHYIIPNALMSDTLPPYKGTLHPNNAIFSACFERGGEVAERVWTKVKKENPSKWGDFMACEYPDKSNQKDKNQVFQALGNARYFLYPLVLPPGPFSYSVHRDTFGCAVAEAIACGVEVLSYPVGALEEHYKDMIHWIPFPLGLTKEDINQSVTDPRIPELFGDLQVNIIANMLNTLDASYEQRAGKRAKDAERVRSMYHANTIGEMWHAYFKNETHSGVASSTIEMRKPFSHCKNKHGKLL